LLFLNPNKTQIFKPKLDLKSTLSNPNSFKLQTSIKEKPSGERDPWLHENRSGRGRVENSGGESRAFGRRESEIFRKNGCLVTRIVEIGIANQE
jgi:hypothetical protein